MIVKNGERAKRRIATKKKVVKKASKKKVSRVEVEVEGKVEADSKHVSKSPPLDHDDPKRGEYRRRASEVEMWDPDEHPVDQFYKGTQFHKRLQRAKALAEELDDRPLRGKKPTRQVVDCIFRIMREGLTQFHAEVFIGLSEKAISNWSAKGKRDGAEIDEWVKNSNEMKSIGADAEKIIEKLGKKPKRTVHMYLRAKVLEADASGEVTLFGKLVDAVMEGDAQTGRWLLERRWPHKYGRFAERHDLHEVEGDGEKNRKRSAASELLEALVHVASED